MSAYSKVVSPSMPTSPRLTNRNHHMNPNYQITSGIASNYASVMSGRIEGPEFRGSGVPVGRLTARVMGTTTNHGLD